MADWAYHYVCYIAAVVAGLVPATSITRHRGCKTWAQQAQAFGKPMHQYYVNVLASRPGGALYIGVTNDLVRRVYEHKMKLVQGHTKRYQIDQLVYFEVYDSPSAAIQREKNMKHWPRAWRTKLIGEVNPTW